jgi:septal ring factor EnvC (AmiA/AmiB activator)
MSPRRHFRLGAAVPAVASLVACASVHSVADVHATVDVLRARIAAQQNEIQATASNLATLQLNEDRRLADDAMSVNSLKDALAELTNRGLRQSRDLEALHARLDAIEDDLPWRATTRVSLPDTIHWHTVYGNGAGRSEMVMVQNIGSRSAIVHIRVKDSKREAPLHVSDNTTESAGPEWDLTLPGALRVQRLDCGQEVQATSAGAGAQVQITIRPDPRPHTC